MPTRIMATPGRDVLHARGGNHPSVVIVRDEPHATGYEEDIDPDISVAFTLTATGGIKERGAGTTALSHRKTLILVESFIITPRGTWG